MPRAVDRRVAPNDYDPLAGLLDFSGDGLLDQTAELVGETIRSFVFGSLDRVVDVIKELTGIDLSSWLDLIEGISGELGLDLSALSALNPVELLPKFLAAFQGINLESGPGAILAAIATALEDVPIIGDIVQAITGVLGGDLDDLEDWAQRVPLLGVLSGLLSGGVIPLLDASKIGSGLFNIGRIPGLPAEQIISGALDVLRIPGLDVSKIISGVFSGGFIPSLDASKIGSGVFGTGLIPNLSASKITSGVLNVLRLPDFDAAKIVSGVFGAGFIPGLDASKITSGAFAQSMVTGLSSALSTLTGNAQGLLDALYQGIFGGSSTGNTAANVKAGLAAFPGGNIVGSLLASVVPLLDASKIGSGTLATGLIPNITKAMSTDLQGVVDNIFQAINGGSTTGNTLASIKTALANIPGGNIASVLLASVIPSFDASKVGTGTLSVGRIPGLPTSQITSGTFPQSMLNITSVAGSLISGLLSAANIPGLDASKVTGGTFGVGRIPQLGRSKIIGTNDLTNLLEDGGFESPDTVNPGNATIVTITDPAVGGTKALQQISTGGNVDSTIQPSIIDVKEGQYLYIKGRIRKLTTGTTGQTGVYLTATLDGATPNYPGFSAVPGGLHAPAFTMNELVENVWTSYEGIFQVPAGKNRIAIRPSIRSSVPAGQTIQHDDLEVREVTMSRSIIDEIAAAWGQSGQSLTTIFNNVPGAKLVGQVAAAIIPGLDASKITSGQFAQSMVNITSIAANLISGALAAVNIPGLDASKITSGTFAQSMVNITSIAGNLISSVLSAANIPGLDASKVTGGTFGDARIPSLNTSKITAGVFPLARFDSLDTENLLQGSDFEGVNIPWSYTTGGKSIATDMTPPVETGGTKTLKFTGPSTGSSWGGGEIAIQGGDRLIAGLWVRRTADFDATDARLRLGNDSASSNTFNITFGPGNIPADTWVYREATSNGYPNGATRLVPSITMTGHTTGSAWVKNIVVRRVKKASWLEDLDTSKIVSGLFAALRIPGLDASKITSGQFAQSMVNITSVAAELISGALAAVNIPSLDASKVTSGQFPQSMVNLTSIAASLVNGALALANIPGLPGSQITSGSVAAARIASLDASKINSGQFPQSMVNITSIAATLVNGVLTAGNIPTLPQSKITDLPADLGTAVANAGDALTTASGWVTGFFNGITGQSQTNVPVEDAQAQAASLAETQAALAAAVSALQNTNDGGANQGVAGIDEFDRVAGADLGGTGYWQITHEIGSSSNGNVDIHDGNQVDWHDSGGALHRIHFRCTNAAFATTLTDYQKVTLTCGSIAAENQLPFDSEGQSWRIRVRENATATQYVFIEFGGGNLAQWGYRNGGSEVYVGSTFSCPIPTPGSTYTVEAGLTSGVRYFRLRRNGVAIGTVFNDTGLVTALGASNRGHGFDMQAAPRAGGSGQSTPASVGSYSVADNVPPTVVGSGLQVYRNAVATQNLGTGDQPVVAGFFDMVEASTPSITWNAATSTATVVDAGWYTIDFGVRMTATMPKNPQGGAQALIYINGAVKRRGQHVTNAGDSSNGVNLTLDYDLNFCKSLYLTAGSTIRPGTGGSHALTAVGNANGDLANLTIVRGKQ